MSVIHDDICTTPTNSETASPCVSSLVQLLINVYIYCNKTLVPVHCSLSAVTHAPFHASMLRPASQAGPMLQAAGVGEVS